MRLTAVMRMKIMTTLWNEYNGELGIGSSQMRVGRTVFMEIAGKLTKGQIKPRSCIEYYQFVLVH